MQFLAETVELSVVGGLAGIFGGWLCAPAVGAARWLLEKLAPQAIANLPDTIRDLTPTIVPWSIPLAFGIALGVGVVFGLYPAVRAAAMNPVEALRNE